MGRFKLNTNSLLNTVFELEKIQSFYIEEPTLLTFSALGQILSFSTNIDLPEGKVVSVEAFKFDGKTFKVTIDDREYEGKLELTRAVGIEPLSMLYLIALNFGSPSIQPRKREGRDVLDLWLTENNKLVLPVKFAGLQDCLVIPEIVNGDPDNLELLLLNEYDDDKNVLKVEYSNGNLTVSRPSTGEEYTVPLEELQ